jgi:hypothetical protein
MPPALVAEIDARKSAEDAILQFLKEIGHPVRMAEVLNQLAFDENTARRAVLRLAASGRATVGQDFHLSLARAA